MRAACLHSPAPTTGDIHDPDPPFHFLPPPCAGGRAGLGGQPGPGAGHPHRQHRRAVRRGRHLGHDVQERGGDGHQGDQCRRRHPGPQDRLHHRRHPEQPGRGQGPDTKGHRQGHLRHLRPGVLGLHHGQHGREPPRRGAQFHRRRGSRHHRPGQPLCVPHVLRAERGLPQAGALHQRQVAEAGGDLREQRLRQGRAGHHQAAAGQQPHPGGGRDFHRPGPDRFLAGGAAGQAGRRRRHLRLHQRGRVCPAAARAAQAGLDQACHRRDHPHQRQGGGAGR